jgi:hypothetical protein
MWSPAIFFPVSISGEVGFAIVEQFFAKSLRRDLVCSLFFWTEPFFATAAKPGLFFYRSKSGIIGLFSGPNSVCYMRDFFLLP